jgi:hypothetical protein
MAARSATLAAREETGVQDPVKTLRLQSGSPMLPSSPLGARIKIRRWKSRAVLARARTQALADGKLNR